MQEDSNLDNVVKDTKEDVHDFPQDANEMSVISRNEFFFQESQSLFSDATQSYSSQSQTIFSDSANPPQMQAKQEVAIEMEDGSDTMASSERTASSFQELDQEVDKLPVVPEENTIDYRMTEAEQIKKDMEVVPGGLKCVEVGDRSSEIKTSDENKQENEIKTIGENNQGNEMEKVPSLAVSMVKRDFATKEEEMRYKLIVDRCLKAFALCLRRFPEHYKSQYKIAFVATYFENHKVSCQVISAYLYLDKHFIFFSISVASCCLRALHCLLAQLI